MSEWRCPVCGAQVFVADGFVSTHKRRVLTFGESEAVSTETCVTSLATVAEARRYGIQSMGAAVPTIASQLNLFKLQQSTRIVASVTPTPEPCDWRGYVGERLQAQFPECQIAVHLGVRNAISACSGMDAHEFDAWCTDRWVELCEDPDNAAWTRGADE